MHPILKKQITLGAIVAATACSISYSIAAADVIDTTPREAGGKVKGAAEGAVKFVDDVAITTAVKTKLIADEQTKARDIKVITEKGVVRLIGEVDSNSEQREAESVARSVDGVQAVKNELKVKAR
ncbi:BON domain-containing protein [Uliginosibacterium sp. H3]|uniref:BON domain-containing protein n=1 Tax=Uliginosibacterium silvisoli TaxID=3114758 RepID=A0ABU6KA34_9RHOO|nr:BON domain-containing protein [Uliginosibacterium sp. H3]